MSGPLYVPVLPARPHAAEAYRRLRPDVQSAVAPVWNLPTRPGLPPETLATEFRRDLAGVVKAQRYRTAWLDAPGVRGAEGSVLAELLEAATVWGPFRPVTGPGRPAALQHLVLDVARRAQDGFGIRVPVPGEWDDLTADRVRELLRRADPTAPVDLLVDLEAVPADRPEAGKEAVRALDALIPLAAWRTVALLSGGFPEVTADMVEHDLREVPRTDWRLWQAACATGRSYLKLLAYGDYGTTPPSSLARPPHNGPGGPAWGVLRYTAEQSFVLARVLSRGDDHVARNRASARQLVQHDAFRGPGAGSAEAWLRDCAHGSGGTGNSTTWLWVGNAQHMTYVVRSMRS
ncbi:beta family protein [Streptomyces sp. NPDC059851]|uniref:beta family protein n=1 Tax=Streptomyces sp. NPDC059851 TaxID=3346971 RepID=UPI00364DBA8F